MSVSSVFRTNSARIRVGFMCFLSVFLASELGKDVFSMFFVNFDTYVKAFLAESSRIPGHILYVSCYFL